MIISWNTDPSKGTFTEGSTKFSSYYQYDTVSRKLVRIRLELGRTEGNGHTQVIYSEDRAVGFSDIDFVNLEDEYPDSDFTINPDTGELLVKGVPLSQTPKADYNVVDMSTGELTPHFGNPVSKNAFLPEGIENKHLSLLANEAFQQEDGIVLSDATASAAELSASLKAQVSKVVGLPFDQITDTDILNKLKEQVTTIRESEIAPSKANLNDSMNDVDSLLEEVRSQITDKGLVPTSEFENAFQDLSEKVQTAKDASQTGTGIKDAVGELSNAMEGFKVEAAKLDSKYYNDMKDQIIQSDEAIELATVDATDWELVNEEYQSLESATTLDEYENEIGLEETEAI